MAPDKPCTKCGRTLPLSQFYFLKAANRHHSWCKACFIIDGQARYRNDPAKHAARSMRWNAANLQRKRDNARQWYQRNKLATNARRKELRDAKNQPQPQP